MLPLPANAFACIITNSDYGFRKPHKRIFEIALRKAGLPSNKVWYCGDNAVWDVEGAYHSGLTPVWYKGVLTEAVPLPLSCEYVEIFDWMECIRLLESLIKP